jgi:diphthine-ammonia ligase
MSYVTSWSGGKDGCFACYQAIRQGYHISHLVNFIAQEHSRVRFHGTDAKLIQMQSQAVGIPLLQKETSWDGYERDFKEAVSSLVPSGVEGMVFGDIYLDEHKEWVERVCREIGIKALEPLWGRKTSEIFSDFIASGFQARIVGAKAELIGEEWMGRYLDEDFKSYLESKGIDPCGENGEYHTLVVDGPIFQSRLEITESKPVKRENHYFWDITGYRLVPKE